MKITFVTIEGGVLRLFLGVDGGGTKTRVAVCDETGKILAKGEGGPSNPLVVGIDGMILSIKKALKNAGIDKERFEVAVFGLAGAGFSKDNRKKLAEEIKRVVIARNILVYNDSFVALKGALGSRRKGILVVAGTGSIVIGIDKKNQVFHVGGWGHLLGDEGSAYKLSVDSIKAVMKYWEGRGRKTKLEKKIREFFKVKDVDDIINLFYQRSISKNIIASFSRVFMEVVEEGDPVAEDILLRNLEELSEGVIVLSKKLKTKYVSYTGGMFDSWIYKRNFQKILKRYNINLKDKMLSPVGGALIIALNQMVNVDKKIIKNLKKIDKL